MRTFRTAGLASVFITFVKINDFRLSVDVDFLFEQVVLEI